MQVNTVLLDASKINACQHMVAGGLIGSNLEKKKKMQNNGNSQKEEINKNCLKLMRLAGPNAEASVN